MAFTNLETKEIHCKILYLGPPSAGKTANLRSIFLETAAESQDSPLHFGSSSPTPYFDFLPVSMGYYNNFSLRLHLYTLPKASVFPTVHGTMLRGIDGCVFVADSRKGSALSNPMAMAAMRRDLVSAGVALADLPWVLQYNKRDCADAMPFEAMDKQLNPLGSHPAVEAIAHEGKGTRETLNSIARLVVRQLQP